VVYLVRGKGYYEVFKEDASFYDYNLDINDQFPDSTEQALNTGLLRRKWIVNTYYGAAPVLTWRNNIMRVDIGGELRYYSGDHFGEVSNFSNEELQSAFSEIWYKYYQYIGSKTSFTGFIHLLYTLTDNFKLIGDLQYQGHRWELEQKLIGHAKGHNLSAPWNFVNPRFGLIYDMNDKISVFANYGKAQKEPADNQIIEADDVWSEPIIASAEILDNSEIGFSFISGTINSNLNIYRMNFKNEQLKNIDIEQEGEYNYYSADATIHQGIEFDVAFNLIQKLDISFNGAINHNSFGSGNSKGNILPNTPLTLGNSIISYQHSKVIQTFVKLRYVGKQFVDDNNTPEGVIDPFTLLDIGSSLKFDKTALNLKINNLFDTMYSTFGYGYEWDGYWAYFWPGATRSFYANLEYHF
jgi:iron complex outermembrane receptor protein